MRDYRTLDVWKKAHEFALELRLATQPMLAGPDAALIGELRQSSVSIAVILVLGCEAESAHDFGRAMRGAAGAVDELRYLLLLARDAGVLADVPYAKLEARVNQLAAMLGGLNRTLRLRLEGGAPQTPRRRPARSAEATQPPVPAAPVPDADSSRPRSRPRSTS